MNQNINVPQLRFKEFNGEWEEKKLSQFSKIERGKFTPRPRNNPIYYNGEIPFVQTSDVVKSKGRIDSYTQTLNEKGLKVSKLFKKGTILITIAANIGYSGILELDMACPDSLIGLTCDETTSNVFLNYLLEIEQPRIDYLAIDNAQKNINIDFLKPYKFSLPSKQEQEKIASFLTSVDTKIQQLSRKARLLESYKKGVMQKIFSGELRFKRENGSEFPKWEEKKLGEIAKITIGEFVIKTKQNPEAPYPVYNGGRSNTGFYNEYNNEGNQVIISARGANAGFVNFETGRYWAGNSCYSISILDNNLYNINFYYYYIKHFENRFTDYQQAANIPSVSKKEVSDFKIIVLSLKEQIKIANFLSSIDTKIEQTKSQLRLSKEFKKALLGQMFV